MNIISQENTIITLAEFYAFGNKSQKIYFDKDVEFIKNDLKEICNTNKLISLSSYSSKLLSKDDFNTKNQE